MSTLTTERSETLRRTSSARRKVVKRHRAKRQRHRQDDRQDSGTKPTARRSSKSIRSSNQQTNKTGSTNRVAPHHRGSDLELDVEHEVRDDFTLAHAYVFSSYVVGIALVLMFGLDLLVKIPFRRASALFDIVSTVCGLGLIYLSFNCHRDLK